MMRNLSQYPITLEEKLRVLDRLIEQEQERIAKEMIMGDITLATLRAIRADVTDTEIKG